MIFASTLIKAQCPQIYNYLGTPTNNPQFINCSGGAYNLNFQASSGFGAYTINWGDGSANTTGSSYIANALITHLYAATINTYVITLNIPSASCTQTALVVNEQPVFAGLSVAGGASLACAPKTLTFNNVSTFVSATTTFTFDFGDGSPLATFSYTNAGQQVSHTYLKNTVNCQTQVILQAKNYCSFGIPANASINPLLVYDVDQAAITPDKVIRCWPDNTFLFTNTTNRNCLVQGNTFQRQEWWDLGNYWGGGNVIINWSPWPPTTPISVTYPSVGTYTAMLRDSNLCGIDTAIISVSIVNPPTAGVVAPTGPLCQNVPLTFTNSSAPGYSYLWNFGTGAGFVNLGNGNQSHTFTGAGTFTVQVAAFVPGGGSACTSTAQVVVTILPAPTASFAATPTVGCNSLSNVTFTNTSLNAVSWNWNFANGNTSTLQNPPPQNYTTTGAYNVSLTVTSSNTCTHKKVVTIIVHPKPVANFSPTTGCVGSAVNFTNSSTVSGTNAITGYLWNFGDGGTASITNPIHTYTAPNTYTVQLIAINAFCKDTVIKNFIANVKPSANFVTTPTIACPPFNVTFTNTTLNGVNYLWNFGVSPTATSNAVNSSFIYSNTTTGIITQTITLIAGTGIGCSDTIKKTISVYPKPIANFTANLAGGCSPLITTFTNTSLGASTYSWSFGDGVTSTSINPIHTYTNTSFNLQTVTITLVSTNSFGCVDSIKKTLQVYPQVFAGFTMLPSQGCSPLSINFPAVSGVVTYTWDWGDGSPITNSVNPVHVFTNTTLVNQTYTVTLMATNAFGCMGTSFGYPIIYPKSIANFSASVTSGCSPLLNTFTNTSIAANSYTWNFGDGTSSTATNTSHTYTNNTLLAQTLTITLITNNITGCKDSLKKTVQVFPKPLFNYTMPTNLGCTPVSINYTATPGVTSYTWNWGDGTPITTTTLAPISHTYVNSTLSNQTYTVKLIAGNIYSCIDSSFGYPQVYYRPIANYTATPNIGCSPVTTNFTNTSVGNTTSIWIFNNGLVSTSSNANSVFTNTTNLAALTYSVKLLVGTANSCYDSIAKPITVFSNPKSAFSVDTPACSPRILTFTNSSVAATSYFWNFGNGATSAVTSPSLQYINNTGFNQSYTVNLISTNINNCKDTLKVPLIIHPKPVFFISALPDSGCTPLKVFFPNINGVQQYNWIYGDGNTASTGSVSNTFINTSAINKTFTVQLIGKDVYTCSDTTTKIIKVFAKPTAAFSADPLTVFVPNQATQCLNLSSNATSYNWTFGDGDNSTDKNPAHTYNKAGEYQIILIATSANGCKDTFNLPSKIIALEETFVQVPNAFTPNTGGSPGSVFGKKDLSNDVFHPQLLGTSKYLLSIYSRWGELLFETKNPDEGWDGYYHGKLCTQDVYIWKITATFIDGKSFNKTGDVLLMR
jgi:gliding motility-associated-like protein